MSSCSGSPLHVNSGPQRGANHPPLTTSVSTLLSLIVVTKEIGTGPGTLTFRAGQAQFPA